MAENMLSGFSDGKDWASGSIWSNPNFQSLLAGLGGAIDQREGKQGIGGQVGGMFQKYIQSVEAQKAIEKQMREKSLWSKIMAQALGLGNKPGGKGSMLGATMQSSKPVSPGYGATSAGWLDQKPRII